MSPLAEQEIQRIIEFLESQPQEFSINGSDLCRALFLNINRFHHVLRFDRRVRSRKKSRYRYGPLDVGYTAEDKERELELLRLEVKRLSALVKLNELVIDYQI